jgi:H+/Cl- antiporter ClcA
VSQFDLIPEDYRRRRSQEQDLIKLASLGVFLVVVALLVSGILLALITQEKQKFTGLSQQQLSVEEQGNQLKVLDAKILGMAQQLSVLSGFRGGLTAPSLLLALDRSLQEDDVWFSTVRVWPRR